MTLRVHAFDKCCPGVGCAVNLALAQVVARDEEGSLRFVLLQEIEDLGRVDVWTIIVSDSYCARNLV